MDPFLQAALDEARQGLAEGGIPIGSVLLLDGRIVGRGHNRREVDRDPTAHAEVIALRQAAEALGSWRLNEVTLVVTNTGVRGLRARTHRWCSESSDPEDKKKEIRGYGDEDRPPPGSSVSPYPRIPASLQRSDRK